MSDLPYRVLLYNDDRNTMEAVAAALGAAVPQLSEPQAIDIMMSAHTHGAAPIVLADRTTATAYCQALEARGLTCAIEPAVAPALGRGDVDE